MIRKLKVLGLALVALSAFAAVAASGASAQGKLTTEGGQEVTLTATETGTTFANSFTAFGGITHCPGSTITGHKSTTTPHGLIPNNATAITLTPHFKNCTTELGGSKFPTTVDMNGCDFLLTIGAAVSAGTYKTEAHVTCPAGKFIQITQFLDSGHFFLACTETITTTTPHSTAHITNTPESGGVKDDLDVVGTFTSIEAHKSGGCGSATTKEAVQHIHGTVKAVNKAGVSTGITVSG